MSVVSLSELKGNFDDICLLRCILSCLINACIDVCSLKSDKVHFYIT